MCLAVCCRGHFELLSDSLTCKVRQADNCGVWRRDATRIGKVCTKRPVYIQKTSVHAKKTYISETCHLLSDKTHCAKHTDTWKGS